MYIWCDTIRKKRHRVRMTDRQAEKEREMNLYLVKFFDMKTFSLSRKKREWNREKEREKWIYILWCFLSSFSTLTQSPSLSLTCKYDHKLLSATNPAFVFTVFLPARDQVFVNIDVCVITWLPGFNGASKVGRKRETETHTHTHYIYIYIYIYIYVYIRAAGR